MERYFIETNNNSFIVVAFPFFNITVIQIVSLLLLESEALSSITGAKRRGIPLKQSMMYNSLIVFVFPFFANTVIQIMYLFSLRK